MSAYLCEHDGCNKGAVLEAKSHDPDGCCYSWACCEEHLADWTREEPCSLKDIDYDPTPYCSICKSMTKARCDCGPILKDD